MVSFDLTAYILSSEGNMKCRVRQWFLLLTLITIIGKSQLHKISVFKYLAISNLR